MRTRVTIGFFAVAAFAAMVVGVVGCEDGPPQTFQPATGTLFNNGLPEASVDPSQGPLDAGYAGVSATALCTADFKRKVWANMLTQAMTPPRKYAGVDLAGGDLWPGLKIDQVEQPPDSASLQGGLCQAGGSQDNGDGTGTDFFGNNNEVQISYNLGTHFTGTGWDLEMGYTGTVTFHDRSGQHMYVMGIGQTPTKDGKPFLIPATNVTCVKDPNNPCYYEVTTELYNAIMVTFAPVAGISYDTDDPDCHHSGTCLDLNDTESHDWLFGVRPLGFYFQGHSEQPQPLMSQYYKHYGFLLKLEPFSRKAKGALKLDAQGPFAALNVGDMSPKKTCTLQLGQTYQDYLGNCIQPWDPGGKNKGLNDVDLNKIKGGRTHDYENIAWSVAGANEYFTQPASVLGTYGVVQDKDMPDPAATATEWYDDLRANIQTGNDQDAMGNGDNHGTGLIMREFARLVQIDINQDIPQSQQHQIGDTSCYAGATYAPGCTGMESFVVEGPAYPSDTVGTSIVLQSEGTFGGVGSDPCGTGWGSLLQPNQVYFCFSDALFGKVGGWFGDAAMNHVGNVLGQGKVSSLPLRLQDRRLYLYYYGIAYVKYLHAYAMYGASTTPAQVAAAPIDLESYFIDTAGEYDRVEYIDRASADATGVPLDFTLHIGPRGGQQDVIAFYRRLDREERAMYTAMLVDKTHPAGQENNVNLTNLFGSPVVANAYPSLQCASEMWAPTLPSSAPPGLCTQDPTSLKWSCSTCTPIANSSMVSCPTAAAAPDYAGGMTPGPCNGVTPPPRDAAGYTVMDLNGKLQRLDPANAAAYPTPKPLLSYYPGVWGSTIFSRGHSPIQVTEGLPGLLGAKTVVPNFLKPYATCAGKQTDSKGNTTCDPADKTYASPIETLVPWTAPGTPGLGFGIPINGQSDQFINTGQLDFTGILESYTVDYLPWTDTVQPSCNAGPCRKGFTCNASQCVASDNSIRVAAIEANDFVGAVFPCQDQLTGDILVVHQYDPTLEILDWLALHPGIPPAGNFGANGGVPSARDACNVIVRFSPYNNFPDKISFNANGVWFNSDTGNGYGRIADVMLFDTAFKTM